LGWCPNCKLWETHADPKMTLIGMWMMGSNARLSNQTLKTL
jgi:hypothetical protein